MASIPRVGTAGLHGPGLCHFSDIYCDYSLLFGRYVCVIAPGMGGRAEWIAISAELADGFRFSFLFDVICSLMRT